MPVNFNQTDNFPNHRVPGVHFEEFVSQNVPVFQTGVPMFVGFVVADGSSSEEPGAGGLRLDSAPANCRAVLLTAWAAFSQSVGSAVPDGFLDYAVRGFFENGGKNCVVVGLSGIVGWDAQRAALKDMFRDGGSLEDLDMIDLVCVPDIMKGLSSSSGTDSDLHRDIGEIQEDILNYCRRMGDRFAIFDGWKDLAETRAGQRRLYRGAPLDGACYFPWVYAKPFRRHQGKEDRISVPPCGHIAGIYARVDGEFGVHRTPANEIIEGIIDLELEINNENQIALNEMGVNCLRSFPGRGIRVWGGRTLSSLANWQYVNVRRLFLTLVRWCQANFDDVIFEPNSPPLWTLIRDRVQAYCYKLFQRGALKGNSPEEAFFVKCDAETNPAEVREAGQIVCEIGLAVVVPAEFIIVRINRNISGTITTFSTGS